MALNKQCEYGGGPIAGAAKEGSVITELKLQEQVIEVLIQTVGLLEDRFRFALQPSRPQCEESTKEPQPSCELATLINRSHGQISRLTTRIRDIIDRCEL
jgi:hypothetical protein